MTARRNFDALIVGAGPAGAYLGYLLAGQGHAVAIIDKQRFPRDKVCGGGVSRKAIDLLDFDLGPVVEKSIRGAVLTYQNRASTIKDLDTPAAVTVLRSEFDHFLLDRAVARGACFFPETTFADASERADSLAVATSRGDFGCRALFAADGAASAVRRRLIGRELNSYFPALEALVRGAPDITASREDRAVFDFGGMARGYGWIFPKRDHLNVGVYSPFGGKSLRAQLDHFMAAYPALRGARDIDYRGAIIPIGNRRKLFQRGRVCLLGDAAGLAEALFGEGIYFALKSAALAARAVAETGFAADSRRYSALLAEQLLPELRAAERMARLIYRFPRFAYAHLVLNSAVNDDFAGLINGTTSYRRCFAKTLLAFPRWLLPSRPMAGPAL